MDDLVRMLLADLSHSLDRLADDLERTEPRLARTLRVEAHRAADGPPPLGAPARRRALRPLLYRALDAGAVDAMRFDRLMTVAARLPRQGAGSASGSPSGSSLSSGGEVSGDSGPSSGGTCNGSS